MTLLDRADHAEARAKAYAGLGEHQWPYGQLSMILDKVRRNATPPERKHCACPGCKHGFMHIPPVSR